MSQIFLILSRFQFSFFVNLCNISNLLFVEKNYRLTVNDSIKIDFNESEKNPINFIQEKENRFHLLEENKAYRATLIDRDFDRRSYKIDLNGNLYNIKISTPLDLLIEKMGFSSGSSKKLNSITAPMPGIIIDLRVKERDEVKEGDVLFILEAMKMENAISAPKSAKIKKINAQMGSTVEKGKLIIELE